MAKAKKAKGRPATPIMVRLVAHIRPDQHARLSSLSEGSGAPIAHYLRTAIDEYLERLQRERPGE